jgi:hypothetical protein
MFLKMKNALGLTAGMVVAAVAMADTIELEDVGTKALAAGKASFVKLDKLPDSDFYVGYRIEAEKEEEGKLHGRISVVLLEGFVMLEDGKLSPLTQFKESKFVIPKADGEWTTITVTKDAKIRIRWIK